MVCNLPQIDEIAEQVLFSLFLRISGSKGESLVYSLSKWLKLYKPAVVSSVETYESGIIFEGIDEKITIRGTDFSLNTECIFLDVLKDEIFFRQVVIYEEDVI